MSSQTGVVPEDRKKKHVLKLECVRVCIEAVNLVKSILQQKHVLLSL